MADTRFEPESLLRSAGFVLPAPMQPLASYAAAIVDDGVVYVSGQGPMRDGRPVYVGKVGRDLSNDEGYKAAELCALNCLAQVKAVVGDLAQVARVLKVVGFVNSPPDFVEHPWIINGASNLLLKALGEEHGSHARSAIGVSSLPLNVAVSLEMVVRVK